MQLSAAFPNFVTATMPHPTPYIMYPPVSPSDMAQWRRLPIDKLALTLSSQKHPQAAFILQQAEGWQRMSRKVPAWASTEGIVFPPRLALEQCSSQKAAEYKTAVVKRLLPEGGERMADLTGGMGVDFSFLAPLFRRAVYVERKGELCEAARHNFPLLGLDRAEVVEGDGVEYLRQMTAEADLLFIDPARRSSSGGKVVLIEDCEPNLCALQDELLGKSRFVLAKLSPMLDISAALRSLPSVSEVHVVGADGECKELLLVMQRDGGEPVFFVHEGDTDIRFTRKEEDEAHAEYAATIGEYLYEPGAAVMKAGAFKWLCTAYGVKKLHPNSHLYTSAELLEGFPGRKFRTKRVYGFDKQSLKALQADCPKANLSVRNFPGRVDALRKKLRLKEGGDQFIFATTTADNQHVLIVCEKTC